MTAATIGALERQADHQMRKTNDRRRFAISLLGPACQDCGLYEPNHPEVYEFDHMVGRKRANVSTLLRCSFPVFLRELKKCDLVCRNCHAIRTKRRQEASH